MTNEELFIDDMLAVCDKYGVSVPPHLLMQLGQLHVPPILGGHDTPDARGLVALTGLDPKSFYAKARYAVDEVAPLLKAGSYAHAFVKKNVGLGSIREDVADGHGLIGVCQEIEQVVDPATDNETWQFKDPNEGIPGTIALPPRFTVASATAWFKSLAEPPSDPNASHGFGPHP